MKNRFIIFIQDFGNLWNVLYFVDIDVRQPYYRFNSNANWKLDRFERNTSEKMVFSKRRNCTKINFDENCYA